MNANSAMMSKNRNFTNSDNLSKRLKLNSHSNDRKSNSENSLKYFSKDTSKGVSADRAKGIKESSSEKTNNQRNQDHQKSQEQIDAEIIKNLDIDSAVKNMKKFIKMIRKIKQINEKDVKQCDNDEYEDHNSNVEAITDFTDDARTTSEKPPNLQKKRSQSNPKLNNNDLRSLSNV